MLTQEIKADTILRIEYVSSANANSLSYEILDAYNRELLQACKYTAEFDERVPIHLVIDSTHRDFKNKNREFENAQDSINYGAKVVVDFLLLMNQQFNIIEIEQAR